MLLLREKTAKRTCVMAVFRINQINPRSVALCKLLNSEPWGLAYPIVDVGRNKNKKKKIEFFFHFISLGLYYTTYVVYDYVGNTYI